MQHGISKDVLRLAGEIRRHDGVGYANGWVELDRERSVEAGCMRIVSEYAELLREVAEKVVTPARARPCTSEAKEASERSASDRDKAARDVAVGSGDRSSRRTPRRGC